MSFLNLWALWIAAGVVPALLILYFLKLRRREWPVPSTLLWKRAVQDLQVNAPFQRLRRNLLLFLQLAVLVLAIVALARPIVESTITNEERVVMLIDRSASMNALEADGRTRLDEAKEQAVRHMKTFNRRSGSWWSMFSLAGAPAQTQVMVIAFADRASIVAPFTTNTSELEAVLRAIEPSDAATDLTEALQLAKAYLLPPTMLTPGMEGTPVSAESPARLVLISDGRIANLDRTVLAAGEMSWLPIGKADDNAGITTFRTQRSYERPEIVEVFLTVRNFGREPIRTDLSVLVDGRIAVVRTLSLAARPDPNNPAEATADRASLALELPIEHGGVVEARLSRDDALSQDNSAYAVVPPPQRLRVVVVTEKNALLNVALGLAPLLEYPFVKPAEWEANAGGRFADGDDLKFDVAILDKYQPKRFPRGNYLFLGAAPPLEGVVAGEPLKNHALIWWDETHPILRHVAFEFITVFESTRLTLPKEAEVLVEGPAGPVLARYAQGGRNCLTLAFALEQSNWWSKQSLPIFLYNTLRYLGGVASDGDTGPLHPGATVRVPAPPGRQELEIITPGQTGASARVDATGAAYFGGTSRVGVYRVRDGVPGRDAFAINLEDADESDIAPPPGPLRIEGAGDLTRIEAVQTATPEVWRWFVGAALALVLLEWWVYNRRVMV
jgi:hypothetical protein